MSDSHDLSDSDLDRPRDDVPATPVQLTFEGLDPTAGIDPRFILDEDTCRRGLRHIRALRSRLAPSAGAHAA